MRPVNRTLLLLAALLLVVWWAWGGAVATWDDDQAAVSWDAPRDLPDVAAASGDDLVIVDLVDGAGDDVLAAVAAAIGADVAWLDPTTADEAIVVGDPVDVAAALAALDALPADWVEAAEPVFELQAMGFPDDPLYAQQWHLDAMGAPAGWALPGAAAGVRVAVIDSGIAPHPDLREPVAGRSFVTPNPDAWIDGNGHGTHVAATIAEITDNGVGGAGVAPGADLIAVKVLGDRGFGTNGQVAAGIHWAVEQGADVINLSLGGPRFSAVIAKAVSRARAAGVVVVAAAGNDGRKTVSWPGALPTVIGVSATGPDGTRAPYSNQGIGVDLSAPGGDKRAGDVGGVWQATVSVDRKPVYRSFQGTSMATPHVSGAAAVLKAPAPGIRSSALDVERALMTGARGSRWTSEHGHGRLDLPGALAVAGIGDGGRRAAVAGVMAWLVAGLGALSLRRRLVATLVAAWVAGGAAWLAAPLGWSVGAWAVRAPVDWPMTWFGVPLGSLTGFVLVIVPLGAALFLGPFHRTRALALGLSAGVAGYLWHGLASGVFAARYAFPVNLDLSWFGIQAVLGLVAALAIAGLERLDRTLSKE